RPEPAQHREADESRDDAEPHGQPTGRPASRGFGRAEVAENVAAERCRYRFGARGLDDQPVQGRLGLENATAVVAHREVLVRLQDGGDGELAVEVRVDHTRDVFTGHGVLRVRHAGSRSSLRSSRRARKSRDITVPSGIARISEISLYEKPPTWASTRGSRYGKGIRSRAWRTSPSGVSWMGRSAS